MSRPIEGFMVKARKSASYVGHMPAYYEICNYLHIIKLDHWEAFVDP